MPDLTRCPSGGLDTTSVLLTSELLTNVFVRGQGLRVEVTDNSALLPVARRPDAVTTGGRGMLLLEALATRWGIEPRAPGKAVWFELDPG